jgi:hypothetical protein
MLFAGVNTFITSGLIFFSYYVFRQTKNPYLSTHVLCFGCSYGLTSKEISLPLQNDELTKKNNILSLPLSPLSLPLSMTTPIQSTC